jgi:hypothetical protein
MSGEVLALGLTLGVHIVGACALIGVLLGDSGVRLRDLWPRDDDGPGGQPRPQEPVDPVPGGGGMPLPDAAPASARLRQPARLADAYPPPARRPAHAPQPDREPASR